MKWFKHMANSSDDEFIVELESIFGLEGYARWWKLLEAVAAQMDGTDRCSVAYSWDKWQTILKGKRKKLSLFLEYLQNEQRINLKENGKILEIEIPKLASLRDDYSKKSGQSPKKIRSKEAEAEVEVEAEAEAEADGYVVEKTTLAAASVPDQQNHPDHPLATLHDLWCSLRGIVSAKPKDLEAMRQVLGLPGASLALVLGIVKDRYRAAEGRGNPPATFRYFLPVVTEELQRRKLMAEPVKQTPAAAPAAIPPGGLITTNGGKGLDELFGFDFDTPVMVDPFTNRGKDDDAA